MNLLKRLFLSVICFFSIQNLWANEAPAESLMENLQVYQEAQGKFVQTLFDQNGVIIQQSMGNFSLTRPEQAQKSSTGKFRWDIKTPMPQLLVADGQTIWFYDPTLKQVTMQKQKILAAQNSPAMLLSGNLTQLSQAYQIDERNTGGKDIFTLTPQKESFFSQIQIIFTALAGSKVLSSMEIKDKLEQKTRIQFSEILPHAAADQFVFKVPPGVDVVQA